SSHMDLDPSPIVRLVRRPIDGSRAIIQGVHPVQIDRPEPVMTMRPHGSMVIRFLASGLAALIVVGLADRSARAGSVGAIVPAYFYPAGSNLAYWNQLVSDASKIDLEVIANPASGPGTNVDPNYTGVIDSLRTAGARVLGYVDTNYASRPIADV